MPFADDTPPLLQPAFRTALSLLAQARSFAADVGHVPWDFAIEIERLHATGLCDTDLRWLVCKGIASPAEDVTKPGQQGRHFGAAGSLRFNERTCFVLTEIGTEVAQDLLASQERGALVRVPAERSSTDGDGLRPSWDAMRRMLTVGSRVVKRYRVPAANQERILNAFDEDDWPRRIDDPLPPMAESEPKRRLQSAIMCLNRNQRNRLIRFAGDGSGTGILWELTEAVKAG